MPQFAKVLDSCIYRMCIYVSGLCGVCVCMCVHICVYMIHKCVSMHACVIVCIVHMNTCMCMFVNCMYVCVIT